MTPPCCCPLRGVRRHAVDLLQGARVHGGLVRRGGAVGPARAGSLRSAGADRLIATTHGHEVGWAAVPAARWPAPPDRLEPRRHDLPRRLHPHPAGEGSRRRMTTGSGGWCLAVDATLFRPDAGGAAASSDAGPRRPTGRRLRLAPDAAQGPGHARPRLAGDPRRRSRMRRLVLVGGGPSRDRLKRLAQDTGVADHVIFTGSVGHDDLPAWYGVGDVFAMPCRERLGGLDVEGLGMVFLEAAACGLPVVAGRSGGSVDAVRRRRDRLPRRRRIGARDRCGRRRPARRPGTGRRDGRPRPGMGQRRLVLVGDAARLHRVPGRIGAACSGQPSGRSRAP